MAVDGSITISTKIDTTSIQQGLTKIKGAIGKTSQMLMGLDKSAEAAPQQMGKAYERARAKVEETERALNSLDAKRDAIAASKREALSFMPFSSQGLNEAVERSLATDKEYAKLSAAIDKTEAKLEGYRLKMNEAAQATSGMAATTGKAKEAFKKLSDNIGVTKKNQGGVLSGFKKIKDSTVPLTKSIFSVANMFRLMVLRMAIRSVINAVKAGFQDLAQYSKSFNTTMSSLSSTMLQARNALASAVAPALQALTPIITSVTNAFLTAMNTIGAFSARLFGGSGTFTKAKKVQTDYAKSVAKANKAMDNQVAAFDELNVLAKENEEAGVTSPGDMFEESMIPQETITFADKLKSILISLMEPLKKISFDNLIDAFGRLKKAASPISKSLFDGLLWAYDHIFVPFSKWYIEDVLPRWLTLVSKGLEFVGEAIDILRPAWEWIWDNVLRPIATWTGGMFLDTIDLIMWAFGDLTEWMSSNGERITGILKGVGEIFKFIWEQFIRPYLQITWDFIKAVFENVVLATQNLMDGVLQILNGLIEFLLGVFTGDWERAWEGVKDILKGVWNGIVSIVEGGVNLIIDAINWLIQQLNKIKIDVPNFKIFGELAGTSFGFNFPTMPPVKIPRLATGAVIPPNAEFLAVLGDQKRGTNIEAPLDTIVAAVMTALDKSDLGGGDTMINNILKLDGEVIYQNQQKVARRRGKNLIMGV